MAFSSDTASPHIPAHFDGCKHPDGGAMGVAACRGVAKANSAASRATAPPLMLPGAPGVAAEKQVRGLDDELAGKRGRGEVSTVV